MLNIDQMQARDPISDSLQKLLLSAKFLVETNQYFELTSEGFHFVLQDTPTQVHMILRKYIEFMLKEYNTSELKIELIKLILNLALSEWNKVYKLKTFEDNDKQLQRDVQKAMDQVKDDFESMGLFEYIDDHKEKFYITKLMQSFLLTSVGNLQSSEINASNFSSSITNSDDQRFIIVENNFHVFAYTDSKIYREILKKIMEPRREFPNLLHGILTRNRDEQAFRQKITTR